MIYGCMKDISVCKTNAYSAHNSFARTEDRMLNVGFKYVFDTVTPGPQPGQKFCIRGLSQK